MQLWGAVPQSRTDRRKDRVESSSAQLAEASQAAEAAQLATGKRTRIIGWYHSHPHITALPSAVDVKTQATYQQLDAGFVGLIFSVFNADSEHRNSVQTVAFQSVPAQATRDVTVWGTPAAGAARPAEPNTWEHRLVPVVVVESTRFRAYPSRLAPLLALQRTLLDEEVAAFECAQREAAQPGGGGVVAQLAAATAFQCRCCALMLHGVAPTLAALARRLKTAEREAGEARAGAVEPSTGPLSRASPDDLSDLEGDDAAASPAQLR